MTSQTYSGVKALVGSQANEFPSALTARTYASFTSKVGSNLHTNFTTSLSCRAASHTRLV